MRFEDNYVDKILNLLELISEKAFAVSLIGTEEGGWASIIWTSDVV